MSSLTPPPRRPLPPQTRARIRARVTAGLAPASVTRMNRLRAPLAAAASVAVLAAGAAIVAQSVGGHGDGSIGVASSSSRPAGPTTSGSGRPTRPAGPPPQLLPPTAAGIAEALDRCAAVAAASPRVREFAPRQAWQPVYAIERDGHRIVAFKEYGGKPGFCDVTSRTATVSDPSAEPMSLGKQDIPGSQAFDYYALYLSEAGVLAGVAQGVTGLRFFLQTRTHGADVTPVLRDEVFMAEIGTLNDGDFIGTTALGERNEVLAGSGIEFDSSRVRPVGATAVDRP